VVSDMQVEVAHHLEAIEYHVANELNHVTALLRALSQSQAIKALVISGTQMDSRDSLSTAFAPILSHIVDFRLLDASGMERVRLTMADGRARFVSQEELVSRANSVCYLAASVMPAGQVFVEALSVPEQVHDGSSLLLPLLRISMQVGGEDGGRPVGLMVLFLNARSLFWLNSLSRLPSHDSQRRVDPGYVYVLRNEAVEVLKDDDSARYSSGLNLQRDVRPVSWLPLVAAQRDIIWQFSEHLPPAWSDAYLQRDAEQAWVLWGVLGLMTTLMLIAIAISRRNSLLADNERQRLLVEVKGLSKRLIRVNEDERRSLARVLHDEVGQVLASLQMRLNVLAEICEQDGCEASKSIRTEQKHLQQVIEALRGQLRLLRPPHIDAIGLKGALLSLLDEIRSSAGLELESEIDADVDKLDDETAVRLYRVIHEAVWNIMQHADAAHVRVHLSLREGRIHCLIEDDGEGFDPQENYDGFGLTGMRERVELMGGSMQLVSKAGSGTWVRLDIPLVVRAASGEKNSYR